MIPIHYTRFRFARRAPIEPSWDRPGISWPEVVFTGHYWAQAIPSEEELVATIPVGDPDEPSYVYMVRAWRCETCKIVIFTDTVSMLDHPCPGLGDAL